MKKSELRQLIREEISNWDSKTRMYNIFESNIDVIKEMLDSISLNVKDQGTISDETASSEAIQLLCDKACEDLKSVIMDNQLDQI